jgi:sec-independent protein translocase protein TatB
MLDFGFSEVVVTSMIALVVLGPKRLPGVMRKIGNWMGRARVMARQLTEQLEREINAEEILKQTKAAPAPPPAPAPPAPADPVISPAASAPDALHPHESPHE